MTVLSFAFCKFNGAFGLVRSFDHGFLVVTFDDCTRRLRPSQVEFI